MTELTVDRCLVIPDVHQDIEWVERIFHREKDQIKTLRFIYSHVY